jgi:ribonuclease R
MKFWKKHQRKSASGGHSAIIEGVVEQHGNFAFLLSETPGTQDAFLRGPSLSLAMNGDRVKARVRRENGGRFSGEILSVVTRAHETITGTLHCTGNKWVLVADINSKLGNAQAIAFACEEEPREGAFAVMKVTRWPTAATGPAGTITEIVPGDPKEFTVRITALLRSLDINEKFPPDAAAQAKTFPHDPAPQDWEGREELFNLPVFTIDGADAKDFDDAVSLETLPGGGVRLGVHIAAVSHYVQPGSPLDREAYARATSVYLPDRVVPMLPHELSDNLCSLVPDKPRLTMSIFIDMDHDAKVLRRRMAKTVIRSCRRFTYEEVQSVLDGAEVANVAPEVKASVLRMGKLASALYKKRIARGALDFNLAEYKIETDADGKPLRAVKRERLQSHRLIEEFMLLANEEVAAALSEAKLPFLHRRHDAPDPLKLRTLAQTLGDMGISAGNIKDGGRKAMQSILDRTQDDPLAPFINSLMVRSMRQAVYAPSSGGHYGIAARYYAHFTSPIRRYPDLVVHRALSALLDGQKRSFCGRQMDAVSVMLGGKDKAFRIPQIDAVAEHCSRQERNAASAEYAAIDIVRAELLVDHVGEVMDGLVTSKIEAGIFVLLGGTGAEGFVRGRDLAPGSSVRVKIERVDTREGKIDLSLEECVQRIQRTPVFYKKAPNRKGKRR